MIASGSCDQPRQKNTQLEEKSEESITKDPLAESNEGGSFRSEEINIQITDISALHYDEQNFRLHNARNIGLIERSLEAVGGARSGVIDEDGRILAGNGLVEAATNVGIHKVKIVEVSGDEIVMVRRKGLTAEQKDQLALYDNRTTELSTWDFSKLEAEADEAFRKTLFTSSEWEHLRKEAAKLAAQAEETKPPDEFKQHDETIETQIQCPRCGYSQ